MPLPAMLSFIVPAHDEESTIAAAIAAIRAASADLDAEIIVVDDASSDRTAELAAGAGAQVVRVEHRQIAAARNAGAAAARGDLLLFVDADTRVTEAAVRGAVEATANGAIGGGATVTFDRPLPRWARLTMPAFSRLFRVLRLAAGCFVFCTRAEFVAVGGFDPDLFAGEEIALGRALKRRARDLHRADRSAPRRRFVVLRATVETSGRKLRQYSGWRLLYTLMRLLFAGRRGLRDRRQLDLWYGPRRADPTARQAAARPTPPPAR